MRKISLIQIGIFVTMLCSIVGASYFSVKYTADLISWGDFRVLVLLTSSVIIFLLYAIMTYRIMLLITPLLPGEIELDSRMEAVYHVYLLFFLILFYPVMRSNLLPVPIMRVLYILLGAKLDENTYSSGLILDPIFVSIGSNSIVGQGALIIPHIIENEKLAHFPIKIGNNVTIGANAVVLSGVTIEDNALVATGAVVKKGTNIKSGETWAGIPAKRIGKKEVLPIYSAVSNVKKVAI